MVEKSQVGGSLKRDERMTMARVYIESGAGSWWLRAIMISIGISLES
jgi:hypothetical protein